MAKKPAPASTPAESGKDLRARAGRLGKLLAKAYPQAVMPLDFRNPFELLVATILAAQCTDARVNMVTPELFARYPDPAALAAADPADVERIIRTTGFFRSKAKNIQASARAIVERFGGKLPEALEDMVTLPASAAKRRTSCAASRWACRRSSSTRTSSAWRAA